MTTPITTRVLSRVPRVLFEGSFGLYSSVTFSGGSVPERLLHSPREPVVVQEPVKFLPAAVYQYVTSHSNTGSPLAVIIVVMLRLRTVPRVWTLL